MVPQKSKYPNGYEERFYWSQQKNRIYSLFFLFFSFPLTFCGLMCILLFLQAIALLNNRNNKNIGHTRFSAE